MNDDVRSPGSGSTPGPLSAQPPPGLGDTDPGKFSFHLIQAIVDQSINQLAPDTSKVHVARCISRFGGLSSPHRHRFQDDFKWNIND